MKKLKKVLVIAHYFPPTGVVGSLRIVKFVKYLPRFHWKPVILTVKESYSPAIDWGLLQDVPRNTKIYRTNCWGIRASRYINEDYYSTYTTLAGKVMKNLLKIFFFPLPDQKVGWFFPAVLLGKTLIKKEEIDLIYTSSPPHSVHFIGYFLKKFKKIPWIVDFRDPWASTSDLQENVLRHEIKRKLLKFYEQIVVKGCDLLITTTEATRKDFLNRYRKDLTSENVKMIPNGYDEDDYSQLNNIKFKKNKKFIMTYTGTFQSSYKQNTPQYFLKALKKIIVETPDVGMKINVNFIGIFNKYEKKLFNNQIFQNVLIVKEHVSYRESILYQIRSDVLLLFLVKKKFPKSNWPIQRIPTKLYEYIRAQKPILALVDNTINRNFIKKYRLGITINPVNTEDIKEAILMLFKKWQANSLNIHCPREIYQRFDRRELTRKLSELMNELVNEIRV